MAGALHLHAGGPLMPPAESLRISCMSQCCCVNTLLGSVCTWLLYRGMQGRACKVHKPLKQRAGATCRPTQPQIRLQMHLRACIRTPGQPPLRPLVCLTSRSLRNTGTGAHGTMNAVHQRMAKQRQQLEHSLSGPAMSMTSILLSKCKLPAYCSREMGSARPLQCAWPWVRRGQTGHSGNKWLCSNMKCSASKRLQTVS